MRDDLPYRTPINFSPAQPVSSEDELNIGSLREIRNQIASDMEHLKSTLALDLSESEFKIKQQVKIHQIAYGILEPLLQTLDSTLEGIDNKWKQR